MIHKLISFSVFLLLSAPCFANMVGSDAQNFSPTQDGLDFVTVHSSETLEPGIFNFGLFINYAQNTFPTYEGFGAAPTQSVFDKNDSFTSADINFAVGVFNNFQVGMSFPYVIDQTIEDDQNLGQFEGSGTSEIRAAAKYRISNDIGGWGLATVLSLNHNRIENNPYVGEDAGLNYNLEFVIDNNFGKWNWALNLGYRWRNPGDPIIDSGIDPLPSQYIASTAASYLFSNIDTKVIFEIYASQPTKSTTNLSNRQGSSVEALLGLKHDLTSEFAIHIGGGTELAHGTSTPDWRAYAGVNYAFGPSFSKPQNIIEKPIEKGVRFAVSDLQFIFNSTRLTDESFPIINELVKRIRATEKVNNILVEGHTDSIGSSEYNIKLGKLRAETVKQLLVKYVPIEAEKITALGKGEDYPIADNGNYQGRQKNRRVELQVD